MKITRIRCYCLYYHAQAGNEHNWHQYFLYPDPINNDSGCKRCKDTRQGQNHEYDPVLRLINIHVDHYLFLQSRRYIAAVIRCCPKQAD